jgi:hypothetical protein
VVASASVSTSPTGQPRVQVMGRRDTTSDPTYTPFVYTSSSPAQAHQRSGMHSIAPQSALSSSMASPHAAAGKPNSAQNFGLRLDPKSESSVVPNVVPNVVPSINLDNINLDKLAVQIERKIMRQIVVESERRGQARWR